MLLWLFIGIVIGMVLVLVLLNKVQGATKWATQYWARVLSLVLGIATIIGIATDNLALSIASALALTILVFRGYDKEQEVIERVINTPISSKSPEPEKKATVINCDKIKSKGGKLYIEEE